MIGCRAAMGRIRSRAISVMISFGAAQAMIGCWEAMATTHFMRMAKATRKMMMPLQTIGWKGKQAMIRFLVALALIGCLAAQVGILSMVMVGSILLKVGLVTTLLWVVMVRIV